jgi:hypothetical protein
MTAIVQAHTHNGNDSPLITTADFIKIIKFAGPPNWIGREGEMVFENSGAYKVWLFLGGDWRSATFT